MPPKLLPNKFTGTDNNQTGKAHYLRKNHMCDTTHTTLVLRTLQYLKEQ